MKRLSVEELKRRWQENGELYTKEETHEILDEYFGVVPNELPVPITIVQDEGQSDDAD